MSYIYSRISAADMMQRAHDLGRYGQLGGYHGIEALHDYLADLAEATGQPIELDIVGLCCDFTFYHDQNEAAHDFSQRLEDVRDWLERQTTVIDAPGTTGFFVQNF